jgi:hypothetical protein
MPAAQSLAKESGIGTSAAVTASVEAAQPPVQLPTPTPPEPSRATSATAAIIDSMPTIARQQSEPGAQAPAITAGEPLSSVVAGAGTTDSPPAEKAEGTAAGSEITPALLPPSPLEGNLDAAYPLLLDTPRFLLHYTPGSLTAAQPAATAAQVQAALDHLERTFALQLPGGFDVYAAGSLFAPPDQALRGRSFSALRRLFFLQDGSGSAWDQQYIVGHELTHLYLWNTAGVPSSVMLSEGAAVYAGSKLVEGQGPLPLQQICLAYARAGALPYVGGDLSYQGHIRDLENYYTAGCFVQYLVETYGVDAFVRLYPTSDYWGIYGKSLAALVDEWQGQLLATPDVLPFDPVAFVTAAERVKRGYRDLFAAFGNTPEEYLLYAQLDRARTELLAGRFE